MRIITEQPNINISHFQYLEVVNDCFSIYIPGFPGTQHKFKIGDIIKIAYSKVSNLAFTTFDELPNEYINHASFSDVNRVGNENVTFQRNYTVSKLIRLNYVIDVTKNIKRDEKLNQILSDDSVADVKKNFLSTTPLVPTTNTQNK